MFHSLFIKLGGAIVGAGMLIGSWFGYQTPTQNSVVGAYNPSGGQTYRLQSSISSTQNTITLSSFKEPISNIPYTMTYLNSSIEYGTIEPQNNSNKEFISFTGITQNSDGTATLTGVSRGLSFSYPYTASSTLQLSHSGQSIFILSNAPQVYKQFATLANNEWITGTWGFAVNATTTTNCATASEYCNKAYVDSVAVAGASNADDVTKGIVQTSTATQASNGATLGSTGARIVLGANIASSSRINTSGSTVVVTQSSNNFINSNFISTTSPYIWTSTSTFSGTTTIAAATNTAPLILNSVPYGFPSTRGASSTSWVEDGLGNLRAYRQDWSLVGSTTLAGVVASTTLSLDYTNSSSLHVYIDVPPVSGNGNISIQFNTDTSNNYASKFAINNTTFTSQNTKNVISFGNGGSTGVGFNFDFIVNNVANRSKEFQFTGIERVDAANNAPALFLGTGVWNNTTSRITSITVGAGGGTGLPIGTRIYVYGSRN